VLATFITARFHGRELATGSQQTFARRGRHAVEEIAGAKCSQDAGRKNRALVTANFPWGGSVREQQRLEDGRYSEPVLLPASAVQRLPTHSRGGVQYMLCAGIEHKASTH
jgi:hypothetical protein